jgi:hypothetical protein
MTKEDYTTFAIVVLCPQKGTTYGERLSEGSFVNLLLCDYVCLANLTAVFRLNEEENRRELVQGLMLGSKALTPRIMEQSWGSNPIVQKNLCSAHGDLALIRRWLISLAVFANNTFMS